MPMPPQQIASLRARSGLTQTQLGQMLGVSQPLVAVWESGARVPDEVRGLMLEKMQLQIARADDLNAYRQNLVAVVAGGVGVALALLFCKDDDPPTD